MMGVRTDEHCLRSQVGIGSESDCLLGQLCKILKITDSEAGLKVEKVGGVVGGGPECRDSAEELADKARRSLDIISVKKKPRLSASELAEMQEGRGEESDEMRVLDAGVYKTKRRTEERALRDSVTGKCVRQTNYYGI